MGGQILKIAKVITKTAEKITLNAHNGDIILNSAKSIKYSAKKDIIFGKYKPRALKKKEDSHPDIVDVQFIDENGKSLSQTDINGVESGNATDFLYGKKLKLKIITKEVVDGTKIDFKLKGKTKSINQHFFGIDKLVWEFEIKNNECETELFTLPMLWYSEDFEFYDYSSHYTKVKSEDLNSFTVEVTLNAKTVFLPKKENWLKPIAYRRNYEELIGLFKTDDSGSKDLSSNYENKFISLNSEILNLVKEFSEFIQTEDLKIDDIKKRVQTDAKQLWDTAVKQVQGYTKTIKKEIIYSEKVRAEIGLKNDEKVYEDTYIKVKADLDDRPLYWARNKMQVRLKRHPLFEDEVDFDKSIVKKGTELDKIIILFEEKSRNYNIDFSKAGNKKKVLITGFDPFQLDYKFYGKSGVQTFNPSGIIALALQNNKELLKNNIYVQTCIFPVRYEDFDNQVVEEVVKKHINNQLSLLITTSLNGSNPRFDIEKYAIEYRGGFHDNMCIGDGNPKFNKSRFLANKSSKLIETTLPKEKIFGSLDSIELYGQNIYYDIEKSITTGSGSNYLSNEVMYRATKVRGNSDLPVGHFHLGNLGDINNTNDTQKIVSVIIKKILL